ncbi:hypothetical protein LOS23_03855 [Enterococcus faecium]|nr:hypothetical protein [Enterococcus faecium]
MLNLNIQHIDSIATFNQSVIQIKDHNMTEVKNKIYAFSKKSNDKSYWETLAEII